MKRFGEGLSIIINSISIFLSWPKLIVPLLLLNRTVTSDKDGHIVSIFLDDC